MFSQRLAKKEVFRQNRLKEQPLFPRDDQSQQKTCFREMTGQGQRIPG